MGGVLELGIRLVISMAVVMAVMAGAARFVRRRQGTGAPWAGGKGRWPGPPGRTGGARARKARPTPPLEVVYRRSLAKGAAVSLVQTTGRTFLLGVTEQSVTLLAELSGSSGAAGPASPASALAPPRAEAPTGPSARLDFDEWQQTGRMPVLDGDAAGAEASDNAWKLALESLRERTVRR